MEASHTLSSAEASHTLSSALGTIRVSAEAMAQIVGRAAAESYGIVGMAPRAGRPVGELLARDRLTQGIAVEPAEGGRVKIDIHVVVEYGLNLAEVAAALRSRVAYELTRQTGLEVASVDVHIEDVRRSA